MNEMLAQEVERRAGEAAQNEEYWRFLAWLDQVQPPFNTPNGVFPSYTYKVLLDELGASTADLKIRTARSGPARPRSRPGAFPQHRHRADRSSW